jgi:hypothetical protein
VCEKSVMARNVTFRVVGEDPLLAGAPIFANFVAISHAGNEVQFEFIFLDINELALRFGQPNADDRPDLSTEQVKDVELRGKTVAKMIVPVSSFVQLEEHLKVVFKRIAEGSRPGVAMKSNDESPKERSYGGD